MVIFKETLDLSLGGKKLFYEFYECVFCLFVFLLFSNCSMDFMRLQVMVTVCSNICFSMPATLKVVMIFWGKTLKQTICTANDYKAPLNFWGRCLPVILGKFYFKHKGVEIWINNIQGLGRTTLPTSGVDGNFFNKQYACKETVETSRKSIFTCEKTTLKV